MIQQEVFAPTDTRAILLDRVYVLQEVKMKKKQSTVRVRKETIIRWQVQTVGCWADSP